ncbi:hypothetical protein N7481_006984 [Penicillium waksmanii]|uniref:uncharacterized protein n=1 Tax=Penicillium waksmanii TaxID=69791 RepID=UPI002548EF83|nr:uncharacterized protein N7481_006984 [Penicillium waksmanii]KAJ5979686.1 hypothetical protein N7481_006984 [Penicillium waksmanii]
MDSGEKVLGSEMLEATAHGLARFMDVLNSASLLPPESRPALDSLALIIAARAEQQLSNMRQMAHLSQEITMALECVAKQFNDTALQRCNANERDLKALASLQAQDVSGDGNLEPPFGDS